MGAETGVACPPPEARRDIGHVLPESLWEEPAQPLDFGPLVS